MDLELRKQMEALATAETEQRLGRLPAQSPGVYAFIASAATAVLLSVFSIVTDVKNDGGLAVWIITGIVGGIVYFFSQTIHNRWHAMRARVFDNLVCEHNEREKRSQKLRDRLK